MEILSQTTNWGVYVFLLMIFGGLALAFSVGLIAIIIDVVSGQGSSEHFFGGILAIGVAVISVLVAVDVVRDGPDITYKATITDFNEVYTQGYEIIEKDGNLYTLRESEAE
ncbi:hypothetical protein [Robertmurraya andreesenii]|uniref:Uncharacterized protein n=1 Tax=Anoxybacillus andreesenii TaxID=1325932 RepID=A0ABT9V258_9BACL|nr:hypothetical protein [Robertmurraya andreesenii]MDQ0154950.1 hypothetical protein [Robertmurraya andreesenii]